MLRHQSLPFPPDPNAPPYRIVRGRADPFPLDANAPRPRPDRAAIVRRPVPAAQTQDRAAEVVGATNTTPRTTARHWALPALAAALLALLAGLVTLASPASAAGTIDVKTTKHETSAANRSGASGLSWSACGDGVQCATVSVPLDYDKPQGQRITLAVARRPATDPARRLGSLFVNNGGPGNSVIEFMRSDVTEVLSAQVRARFDIVGMDPRGVGESTPVRCFATVAEQQRFFAERVPFPTSAEETRDFTAGSIEIGRRCAERNGELLDHLSTANVARDLDLLRRAVGDNRLTYAGYSYGGLLGITYANLFPRKVRTIVLDGLPDPAAYSAKGALARREPVTVRVDSATATERALGFFLDRCQAAGPGACAFAAPDTRAKFDQLLERVRDAPVTIETPDGPVTVTPALMVDSLRGALQFPPIWPGIAFLLQAAVDATEHAAAVAQPAGRVTDAEPYDNRREAFLAVACGDTVNPSDPKAWTQIAARAEARNPHFGADWAWQSQPCASWPARDKDRYRGPYTRRTANPVLFVNATFDAASNYEQATATAERLPGARLITLDGAAHPASFVPNSCLAEHINSYLIDQQLPESATVCRPDQEPFE